jgi:hypothetical protein
VARARPRVGRCLLALVAVVAAVCGEPMTRTAGQGLGAQPGEPIVREWAVRGVIVSETRRSAVLEHLPSGRQELVGVGATVTPTVSVLRIDPERVVLGTEAGATTELRLSHGGQVRVAPPRVRARVPPRVPAPPPWRRR